MAQYEVPELLKPPPAPQVTEAHTLEQENWFQDPAHAALAIIVSLAIAYVLYWFATKRSRDTWRAAEDLMRRMS